MDKLFIDIETYSGSDLIEKGLKNYIEDLDFQPTLIAYSLNQEPIKLLDLYEDQTNLTELRNMLTSPNIIKVAHNANFEINCLGKYFKIPFRPEQWQCTMTMAKWLNLPGKLADVSALLKLKGKIDEGKALIKYFCCPCKPTKANKGRTRNLPEHVPEKWDTFREYCIQDVQAEIDLYNKISWIWDLIPEWEKELYYFDLTVNREGIKIDEKFCKQAIKYDGLYKEYIKEQIVKYTKLENPNSLVQLKNWITREDPELKFDSLAKDVVDEVIENTISHRIKYVLETRKGLSKTSTAKYQKALNIVHEEKVHFMFNFQGANTGRWAGNNIQPHNLPRMKLENYEESREKYRRGNLDCWTTPNIPTDLSQLVRTMFIPGVGKSFYIIDYSAIEARVVAWLAGQKWVLDVFRGDGKIYEAAASLMFNIPLDEVTEEQRADGKTGVLACGYQGGSNAVKRFLKDADEEKCQMIVDKWRQANPKICCLWSTFQDMATTAIIDKTKVKYKIPKEDSYINMYCSKGFFIIKLPSGRELYYPKPICRPDIRNLSYETQNQVTRKWERTETYGGKLTENIVQAIARDVLALAMLDLNKAGYKIVMHVHDEVVIEDNTVPSPEGALKEIKDIMCKNRNWCKTLPLNAHGFSSKHYRKE